jgi:hypothetical protein
MHEIYDSDDEDSVEDYIAVDEGAVKPTKRVHRKNNSRANVQEVLWEAEG